MLDSLLFVSIAPSSSSSTLFADTLFSSCSLQSRLLDEQLAMASSTRYKPLSADHHHHHHHGSRWRSSLKKLPLLVNLPYYQKFLILVILCVTLTLVYFLFGGPNGLLATLLPGHFSLANFSYYAIHPQWKIGFRNKLGSGLFHLPRWSSEDMLLFFSRASGSRFCYTNGTLADPTFETEDCVCKLDYYGKDCGIPRLVWKSEYLLGGRPVGSNVVVERLHRPRRIIVSVILFDCAKLVKGCSRRFDRCTTFVERMLRQLSNYVDLFLIVEMSDASEAKLKPPTSSSNNETTSAESNSSSLHTQSTRTADFLSRLDFEVRNGSLRKHASLIMHKVVTSKAGDQFKQSKSFQVGGFHSLWSFLIKDVGDYKPDDLLLFMAPFEYPLPEVVAFLKFYKGFSEPIAFTTGNLSDSGHEMRTNRTSSSDRVWATLSDGLQNKTVRVCQSKETNLHKFYKTSVAVTFEYLSALCVFDFDSFVSKMCLVDLTLVGRFSRNFWPIKKWTIAEGSVREDCFVCL